MRTDEKLAEICDELRQNCGDVHAAARVCGVSPDFLFKWMKDDKTAAEQIEEAKRVGYLMIESAFINRGVRGVDKAVYYKGEIVGYEKQYSDSLLVKLAETRLPDFKKDREGSGVQVNVQVNNMPRAQTYDEWLNMKQRTLSDREKENAALPAPSKVPDILQGTYTVRETTPLEGLGL